MKILKMNRNKQQGFTIIELVIVILVIGILSAVALPRMIDLTAKARASAVASIKGNLSTSIELLRTKWIAEGKPNTVTDLDGQEFYIGSGGNGIVRAVGNADTNNFIAANCVQLWDKLLRNPPNVDVNVGCAAGGTCTFEASASNDICTFKDRDNNQITFSRLTGEVN